MSTSLAPKVTVLLDLRFLPQSFYICLSLYKKLQVALPVLWTSFDKAIRFTETKSFGSEAVGILVEEEIP